MRSVLLAALAITAFAANSLAARAGLADGSSDPVAFGLVRLVAGVAVLLPVLRTRPGLADLPGGLALAIYVLGFSLAYTQIETAAGALILFTSVQITVLAYSILRKERIGTLAFAGSAVALGGLYLLLASGLGTLNLAPLAGMIIAGIAWGGYTIRGRGSTAPLQQTGRQFVIALVVCLPALLLVEAPFSGSALTMDAALWAAASGAVFSGLGYAVWYSVTPRLSAATTASVQLATPAMAAFMGAIILSEALTMQLILAATVILVGVALTLIKPKSG